MLKAQGTPLAGALTSVKSRHLVHIYLSCWRSIFGWSISGRTASCPTQTSASSAGSRSAAESDLLRPTVLTRKPLTAKYPRCISANQSILGCISPRWKVWCRPPLQPGLQTTVSEAFVSRVTRHSSGGPGSPGLAVSRVSGHFRRQWQIIKYIISFYNTSHIDWPMAFKHFYHT